MKKIERKILIALIVVLGISIGGLVFPESSLAMRTDTIKGEINFNMLMEDGSKIPAGKVPTASVGYALRRFDFEDKYATVLDDYLNQKDVNLSYNGATGNYSHSETETVTYGMLEPRPSKTYLSASRYPTYYNLRIKNTPNYVRTISSISSVVGNYSYYTQSYGVYDLKDYFTNSIFSKDVTNGVATIPNTNLSKIGPGEFKYYGAQSVTSAEHPDSVQFAVSGGSGIRQGGVFDYKYNFSSLASNGRRITFFLKPYQTIEKFEDQAGAALNPPTGFTQGKLTYATDDVYTHPMNKLPTTYVSGGNTYILQGWYQGKTKPGTLETTNPPSMTVNYTQSKSVAELDAEGELHVVYARAFTVNEKYVDESDTSINSGAWNTTIPTPPNTAFNGSPAATKTDSFGTDWEYVGWKIGSSGTVNTSPVTIPSVIGNEDIYYIYQRSKTTATLDLTPTPKIVDNNDTVSWTSRLENTGGAPLKDLVLKDTSNWSTGLTDPVQVTVTPAGGSPQDFTVNPGDWASGVNLSGITIPNGGVNNYADITFTTTASGAVNQVLPAEIEVSGNIPTPVKADNFVRIDDPDEPNLKPVGNAGLINIPDFRFGEVEVKPFAQTKGLDASAYRSGYHPYIRFMDNESTGGWSLSAKLGQFTSGTKTLPTTTTLKLRNGVLMDVQNYNKHNESLNYVDLIGSINIPSDSSTVALTNNTNRGVYHLEYDISHVELELMAHSGIAGLYYEADMEWTLTTAP